MDSSESERKKFGFNIAEGSKRGARVKWQEVCHSKDEGGLGLKDILSWNQASMIQHLWSMS